MHPSRRVLAYGVTAGLLVCLAIAAQWLVVGFTKGNWVYGYIQPFTLPIVAIAVLVAAIAIAALAISLATIERYEWPTVVAWLFIAVVLQGLLRSLTPFTIERIFASSGANAFYQVTRQYEPSAVLRDFSRARLEWPLHARSNMPGKVMLMYALEQVATRPRTLAWLLIGASNVGGLLFYALVKDLLRDRRGALFSLVLYALVPGKLYFLPLLNTVTPAVLIALLYLIIRWIRTGATAYALSAGLALYALFVFEPLPLVMGLVPLAFAVDAIRREGDWSRFAAQAAASLAMFAATHVAVSWLTGFSAVAAFRELGAEAVAFNVEAHRRYIVWVWQNLIDFAVAVGICQSVLFLAVLNQARRQLTEPIALLTMSLAAVLLVTDLTGVNRGEVVRLWVFLACFFQIPAAYLCARLNARLAIMLVIAVTVLQDALGTAMIGFIVP